MNLWYFNIDHFPTENITAVVNSFPIEISEEINRYRFYNDQKSKLVARLLIQMYVTQSNNNWNWENWKIDKKNKKPYLENGPYFNISHSHNWVVVLFSEKAEVGIDIEHIQDIDVASIALNFHKHEIMYLKNNYYDKDVFFAIWVRKEALLKASGEGIINGLNKISVLDNNVFYHNNWTFQDINLFQNFKCAICFEKMSQNGITFKEINYETLNKFIYEKILI